MLKFNNTKGTAVLIVTVFAIVMTIGPVTSSMQSASAHYGVNLEKCKYNDDYYDDNKKACEKNFDKHDDNGDRDNDNDDGNGNKASQGIGQSQSSEQNSQVVSGEDTVASGNNFSFQNQENSGNNALAQQ